MRFLATLTFASLIVSAIAQDTTTQAGSESTSSAAEATSDASTTSAATLATTTASIPILTLTTTTTQATSAAPSSTAIPGFDKYKSCKMEELLTCYGAFLVDVSKVSNCAVQSFDYYDNGAPFPSCACPATQSFANCVAGKASCSALIEDIKKEAPGCNIKSSANVCVASAGNLLAASLAAVGVAGAFF
ncbi:hypothetical protein HDU67_005738 [Dinochytrium kinnereticum]|nr:hypothetical protein HDU67_005738 [Dinochytrium kinnereticum]